MGFAGAHGACGFVFGLTSAAGALGAQMRGLLSPFPSSPSSWPHSRAATHLLRGVVIGSFGFAVFFVIVGLLVTGLPVGWAYVLAAIAAVAVNGISLRAAR